VLVDGFWIDEAVVDHHPLYPDGKLRKPSAAARTR
jgi:hypothetical protein